MFTIAIYILMPLIATVAGVKIYMYFGDHNPPHFHAKYGGDEDVFDIDGEHLDGDLPTKKRKKVRSWAKENKDYLKDQWEKHQFKK